MRYSHRDTPAKKDLKKDTAPSSRFSTGPDNASTGINAATPADWNRLREQIPAIESTVKTGLEPWDNVEQNVNTPSHYVQADGVECIDVMTQLYGKQRVEEWAEITAFKYQWRQGKKIDNTAEQDKLKSIWYTRFSMGDDPRND